MKRRLDAKPSSIQFLHFPYTESQAEIFKNLKTPVTLGIGHKKYGPMAMLSDAVREALANDLD